MLTSKEYKERFDKLYNSFSEAHLYFYVWKGLQDEKYNKIYKENTYFWSAVLFSLENTYLSILTKIYEESSYSKKDTVISVYSLVKNQKDKKRQKETFLILKTNKNIIDNLQKLRHNRLAHNNARHLLNPKLLLKKYPVKYAKVEELLESSNELLSNLHPNTGHGYAYARLAEDSENDSKRLMEKLIYMSDMNKEHRKKFLAGKVNSIKLPPIK